MQNKEISLLKAPLHAVSENVQSKKSNLKQIAYKNIFSSVNKGVTYITADEKNSSGRTISVNGKECLSFGFCSYLGLERHPKIIDGVVNAIAQQGVIFSSSRAYLSNGLMNEFNQKLCSIFNAKHIAIFSSITMGHLSTLPKIIKENEHVIFDQQAHYSMQSISKLIKAKSVDVVSHNNMQKLEEKIVSINSTNKAKKIWYIADGVYSMFGDSANYEGLKTLQLKYDNFYIYIDDAHGMSWNGKNGAGDVFKNLGLNERIVLAVSFAKAFGTGGGAIVFPNQQFKNDMLYAGGNYTFSGPIFPPSIGAAIASANIHLSSEIYDLQAKLKEKINWTNELVKKYKLPMASKPNTPIYFLACSKIEIAINLCKKLLDQGFHVNPSFFPAVPAARAGIRFTITNHNTFNDIDLFIKTMAYLFYQTLKEDDFTIEKIKKAFRRVKSFKAS